MNPDSLGLYDPIVRVPMPPMPALFLSYGLTVFEEPDGLLSSNAEAYIVDSGK